MALSTMLLSKSDTSVPASVSLTSFYPGLQVLRVEEKPQGYLAHFSCSSSSPVNSCSHQQLPALPLSCYVVGLLLGDSCYLNQSVSTQLFKIIALAASLTEKGYLYIFQVYVLQHFTQCEISGVIEKPEVVLLCINYIM